MSPIPSQNERRRVSRRKHERAGGNEVHEREVSWTGPELVVEGLQVANRSQLVFDDVRESGEHLLPQGEHILRSEAPDAARQPYGSDETPLLPPTDGVLVDPKPAR